MPTRLNILPNNPEDQDGERLTGRFPSWLHRKLPKGNNLAETKNVLSTKRLHTVCEEARCPNLLECWSKKTATFLIMGKECTRSCGFCSIDFSKKPKPLSEDEPQLVAESAEELGLKHVVITMVARDDLPDGGAEHLIRVIEAVRKRISNVTIELLTSDFLGNRTAWQAVLEAKPEIFNHNIETIRSLTPKVRHTATYERSLELLQFVKENRVLKSMLVKSGLMVGLGESEELVQEALRDLYRSGCDIVTIGQYLQPSRRQLLVKEFVHPDQFKKYEEYGYQLGFKHVYSGPLVRSSYHADEVFLSVQ